MKKFSLLLLALIVINSFTSSAFAEQWMPVNMTTEATYDRGLLGGEGGQHTNSVAISKSNPYFMLFATDVGGLYRSFDEGKTWSECNVGLESRGACEVTIDPLNEKHAVLFGGNDAVNTHNGIYVTTNGADSWQKTFPFSAACQADARDCFAFDPTSYDTKTGMCMRVYWSTPDRTQSKNSSSPKALYISDDGGFTWNALAGSEKLWASDIAVSDDGTVYLGGEGGFFVSRDKGKTFQQVWEEWTLSVDYVSARPENVYVSTWDKVLISTDKAKTFEALDPDGMLPKFSGEPREGWSTAGFFGYKYFNVSPVNPDHMVIGPGISSFNWLRWMSQDGGKTWYQGEVDYLENQIHYSTRNAHNAWSYLDENTVFSTGGDWLTKSTNGGLTYRYANHGQSLFMGYGITVNHTNADMMFIHGQDYGSFASYDGGETWSFAGVHNEGRGCNVHGGWVVSDELVFAIGAKDSSGWFRSKWSSREQELKIARGYHNLNYEPTGLNPETFFCYQSATDENVLFAGVLKSADKGETWEKMKGCTGVLCHNYDPNGYGELYGINGSTIVVSYDNGDSWQKITDLTYTPDSMAYNWKKGCIYATGYAKNRIDKIDVQTKNVVNVGANAKAGINGISIWSVAVDPVEPDIVYFAGAGNYYLNAVSVQRSLDAGDTWEVITRHNAELSVMKEGREGPAEANCVTVNPKTRELWVTTQCYGTWKIGCPKSEYAGGYAPEEKLYIKEKDEGVYLNWYGNGKYDLSNVAFESSISDLFVPHNEWNETVYEGFFGRGIEGDGDTLISEIEVDVAAWHAFSEWENPIYTYNVMRSINGGEWQTLTTTNATEFTDTTAESGNTYSYKIVRTIDEKTTVTKTVTVK